jgi:hypothetical protein
MVLCPVPPRPPLVLQAEQVQQPERHIGGCSEAVQRTDDSRTRADWAVMGGGGGDPPNGSGSRRGG